MGKKFEKFLLLMWKNLLLQRRNPKQTAIEIFAPVLFSSLLIIIRGLVQTHSYNSVFYKPFKVSLPIIETQPTLRSIAWSPQNFLLENVINDVVKAIFKDENVYLRDIPFKNSTLMANFLSSQINLDKTLAGIQFEDSLINTTSLPENISITLRFPGELRRGKETSGGYGQYIWKTNLLFPVYQIAGPRGWDMNEGAEPGYNYEGFLKLQQELSFSIIKRLKSQAKNETFDQKSIQLYMQRFPYPKWVEDMLLKTLEAFISLIIMLSFVYTCINTVKAITAEKENQLKEAMKIMGLPNWLHWTAWFVKSFMVLLITVTLIVILITVKWHPGSNFTVFTYSNPAVLFIFLLSYMCATITFCFAISTFFSKSNTASAMAGMLWFLSYFPFSFTRSNYDSLNLREKLLASLCSNSAMGYGFQLVVMFEGMGEGLQWNNLWKTTTPDDNLKLGYIIIMLIFDTFLYLLIAIYVETVFPGEYGVPRPWYFPFTCTYWFGQSNFTEGIQDQSSTVIENSFFERDPLHLSIGVRILRLRKEFPNKVAVKELTLNMYKDQITVLIGHNGAGKTTIMSILTGMIPPTSGIAIVNGHDIRNDIEGVRNSLGLCPQQNLLFDQLTVKEHLYFYSKLKGLGKPKVDDEIQKFLNLLELESKADAKSETLSGGMKRKLSVGIALCGGSKVVLFDEPTAGLDPAARRTLWDLIKSQKNGRTILLTTHFMDEADLLGDRIAIMADGKLKCCGSSFFLKKKYGTGYNLIMEKASNCDTSKVTALLQKYITNIHIECNIGSELTYILNEAKLPVFEAMFKDLEENSAQLGIISYGISLTTLSEVFMKVGAQDSEDTVTVNDSSIGNEVNYEDSDELQQKLLKGLSLWANQFIAMLLKKVLLVARSWYLFLIQICIPILFLILGIMSGRPNVLRDLPKMLMKLDSYENPITVLTHHSTNKYAINFMNLLKSRNYTFIDWQNNNLSENIFEKTEQDPKMVRMRYISGASFNRNNTIVGWFNNEPYHSPPLTLNLIMNAILQHEVSTDYNLAIFNHPLPFTAATKITDLTREHSMGFQIAFNLGFAMAFASSFYIIFYIRERVSKAKHLQFVSGVKILIFWGATFLCDLLMFIFTSLCITLTLAIFQEDGFTTVKELSRFFMVLFCFGFSILPLIYLISYFTSSASTGYTRMTLMNILTGIAAFLLIQIFSAPELNLEDLVSALHWIFLIIPHYTLCSGIKDIYTLYSVQKICSTMIEDCMKLGLTFEKCKIKIQKLLPKCSYMDINYYDLEDPGIGRNVLYSFCLGFFLICILLIIEFGFLDVIRYKFKRKRLIPPVQTLDFAQDDDVQLEKERIRNATMDEIKESTFVMRDVTKYYKNFLAVNDLCLKVNGYECFGLLGVNGAGKTTTFKMMTGDIKFSYGDAWINGSSLKTDKNKTRQLIGYCPQFDALLDDLTPRETLMIFGLLRGITKRNCSLIAEQLAKEFDFHRYLDKRIRVLSGGNKRKLSTALALIGNPFVVYLDEPTTGMDMVTKRYLWKALCKVRDRGKCIILTTHSMEECEALCTRLAIMVNGTFMCLGSTQRLKSKFSEGYTLIVKLTRSDSLEPFKQDLIKQFVKEYFKTVIIREEHQELITFYIPDKTLSWSNMFGIMEKGKRYLPIEDYSLGQCTLEQVFLTFTKYQEMGRV